MSTTPFHFQAASSIGPISPTPKSAQQLHFNTKTNARRYFVYRLIFSTWCGIMSYELAFIGASIAQSSERRNDPNPKLRTPPIRLQNAENGSSTYLLDAFRLHRRVATERTRAVNAPRAPRTVQSFVATALPLRLRTSQTNAFYYHCLRRLSSSAAGTCGRAALLLPGIDLYSVKIVISSPLISSTFSSGGVRERGRGGDRNLNRVSRAVHQAEACMRLGYRY